MRSTSTNMYIIFSVWCEICTLRNEHLHTLRPDIFTLIMNVTYTSKQPMNTSKQPIKTVQSYSFRYGSMTSALRPGGNGPWFGADGSIADGNPTYVVNRLFRGVIRWFGADGSIADGNPTYVEESL